MKATITLRYDVGEPVEFTHDYFDSRDNLIRRWRAVGLKPGHDFRVNDDGSLTRFDIHGRAVRHPDLQGTQTIHWHDEAGESDV